MLWVPAMGQAHFVKAGMVKPGAVVIDVGVNRVDDPAAKNGYRTHSIIMGIVQSVPFTMRRTLQNDDHS